MDFYDFGFLLFQHEKLTSLGRDYPQARRLFQASLVSHNNADQRKYSFNLLLYWRYNTECTDIRDRIYGLCGLTPERNFPVNYREDIVSLFWRAGEHFNIWESANGATALRRTLDLSVEDLEQNVKQAGSLMLSFDVGCVPSAVSSTMLPATIQTPERSCWCYSGAILVSERQAALFCVSSVSSDDPNSLRNDWHVVVDNLLQVSISLGDKGHDLCGAMVPKARVLIRNSDNGTVHEVNTWETLQEIHRACLEGKCGVQFRIQVPATFIVNTLKIDLQRGT
jgi:hypothetical protein